MTLRGFLFLSILLQPIWLNAQSIVLSGKVSDSQTEEPLIGAHLMLQSDWRTGAVTDIEGMFKLEMKEFNRSDSIIITFVGYQEKVISIQNDLSQIKLQSKARTINEIQVVGEKLVSEEFTFKKISKLDVYKNPSAKADVLLAVNALPASTTVDETANVSFRGSSPAQTGIYFNQVPIYDAVRFSQLNGIGTFSFFNTEIVKNIQVFPSNPPLEFGNSTSGLVSIQSEDHLPPKRITSIVASLASASINHRHPIGKRTGLTLFSNYQFSGGIKALNEKSLENILDFESIDLGLHFVHHFSNNLSLKFFNYGLKEGYDFNYRSPSYQGIFTQSRLNNLSIFNLIKQTSKGNFSINLGSRFSGQEFQYSKANYDIDNQDYFAGIQYHLERLKWGLKAGVTYDGRYQDFQAIVPRYYYAEAPQHPFDTIPPTQGVRRSLEIFGYYKYFLNDQLTIGIGLRKNIPLDSMQDHYLSRQVNLDYQLSENQNLKLAAGTTFQYLLPGELPVPPRISTHQIALDHRMDQGNVTINTSLFYKNVLWNSGLGENIYGIELSTTYKPISNITLDISYTGLIVNSSMDDISTRSIYDLPYFIRVGGEWNFLSRFTIGLRSLFRSGTWYQPVIDTTFRPELDAFEPTFAPFPGSQRYPGYNLIDLSFSSLHSLGESAGLVFFASLGNIFDFRNVRQLNYNFDYTQRTDDLYSRRTIYFGAMVTF